MKLSKDECLYVTPDNKYDLIRSSIKNLTSSDFTILVRFKPDWDVMNPNDLSAEGGLVAKNGMHCGMTVRRDFINDSDVYVGKCIFFSEKELGNPIGNEMIIDLPKDKEWYEFSMRHDLENKKVNFTYQTITKEINYEGDIVDYSHSWLWVGACCGFNFFDINHRHYFNGDIDYVGIYQSYLSDEVIKLYFENSETNVINVSDNVLLISNFKNSTPYKIKDDSGNGNNLIIFKDEWF
jgi:hypothetical protein